MTTVRLWDHHLEDLRKSGLSPETIVASGCYSAPERTVRELLGFGVGPGLVFPFPGTKKEPNGPFVQVKPDQPPTWMNGAKYLTPKGQGCQVYIPSILPPDALTNPGVALYVTEGAKKALKATQEGLPSVALAGVDAWRDTRTGESAPIPDLDRIVWRGRMVYIVYDSDVAHKGAVRWAEFHLARELRDRGAKVFAIRLPRGPNGEKVGLDDYLCTHSVEAFCQIDPQEIRHPVIADRRGPSEPAPRLTLREMRESYLAACRDPRPRPRLGFKGLDAHLRGIAPGEVAQLLARSGVGKTQFLLNAILHNADLHVLLFSLEMLAPPNLRAVGRHDPAAARGGN